ncbi:MAG: N-acetyl-D-Glu racemase DgcA [Pseudomonadota bacterium]
MELEVTQDTFALARAFVIARGSRTAAHVVTVKLTDGAFSGWGECLPYARYDESLDSVMQKIEALDDIKDRRALQERMPAGAARNAVDCALWDLEAKRAGKRVWDLIGMAVPGPEITAYSLSLESPEVMREQAAKNAFRPLLKIKLGTPDDMPRLEAVRAGAPDTRIIVDANEGWSAEVYADLAPHLQKLGVALVEQPLPAGQDDALLGLPRPVPICADESCHDRASLPDLRGKYDMINIKLDKTGGLTEGLELKSAAMAEGFGIMIGCMVSTSLSMAPATLLAQGADFVDLDAPMLLAEDRETPLVYDARGVHPPNEELWG